MPCLGGIVRMAERQKTTEGKHKIGHEAFSPSDRRHRPSVPVPSALEELQQPPRVEVEAFRDSMILL